MIQQLLKLFPVVWGHWLSIVGTVLTTASGTAFLVFFAMDLGRGLNPYSSAMAFLILPFFFVSGLGCIAIGAWRSKKKRAAMPGPDESALYKVLEVFTKDAKARRRAAVFLIFTAVNVSIVGIASYKAVSYTHSPSFCGSLCHQVMEPEHVVYRDSPHSRIACADCHVGSGIGPFFSSKLAGARQLWHMITGDIPRPIPTPVHGLRPAQHTCEHCHWPAKFSGDRILVRHSYKDDEKNSRTTNVVQLHVGGMNRRTGKYEGIHWHVNEGIKIRYEALDTKRAIIGKIYVERDGKTETFYPPKTITDPKTKKAIPYPTTVAETRVMDCVDCHNRPTHVYARSASFAINRSMALGQIDPSIPFIKKEALALLADTNAPRVGADRRYAAKLTELYAKKYPQAAKDKAKELARAGEELGRIYLKNIFPRMKIGWGTYANHLGHRATTEGCFRCHDDEHASKTGKKVAQDCDMCHDVLADGEEKPNLPASLLKVGQR